MNMKYYGMIALVMAFIMNANAQTLYNGSFEEQGESEDTAAGWGRWGEWINRHNDWEPTRDGACLIAYHHWQITEPENSGIYQDVYGAQPDVRYTFKVYAMTDAPQEEGEAAPETIEIRLESTVDGQQKTVASKKYRFKDISTTADGRWSPLRISGTPINDKLRVLIIVEPGKGEKRGGTVKFDDAELVGS